MMSEATLQRMEIVSRPDGINPGQPTAEQSAVRQFAQRMQAKLDQNRHKGGRENWLKDSVEALLDRLKDEGVELHEAHLQAAGQRFPDPCAYGWGAKEHAELVANECADVANFAMMISDWYLERAKTL